jgi:hypothetical protein
MQGGTSGAGFGRPGQWRWGLVLAGGLLLGAAPARAEDTEQRDFSIQVDSKPAGDSHLTITRRDDGSEVVGATVNVQVRFILTHTYTYQGTEVWKGGRLQSLQSTCNDNGKRFQVAAAAEGDGLRVTVLGRERVLPRGDVWTTSYWKLADKRFFNQPLSVLDVDRGEELARRLNYVATEDMNAAGKTLKCYHFRVQGGAAPVELWFDAQHRLVREEFVETGKRIVIQLTGVRR